ncbi:MAG TPA: hypothetical protein VMM12_09535 [Longimicrobiales bacterium]|nr:hypothetical protein [Longimicrobiales bacterium]
MSAGAAGAQGPPPQEEYWTFRTEHFRVTFTPALAGLAREAAEVAERVHAVLREELAAAPAGPIELVVTDHVDYTNGYATPFPSNRVVVFARPPVDMPELAYARDWMELVVAHELVHVFHLDVTGSVGRALRAVFGRVPLLWPVFPVLGTPAWSIEGLATHYESRLTGAGRTRGSFHAMVVRTAALEDRIPDLGQVSTPSPVWPGGQRSYVYGASFMGWLATELGPEVHARLVGETAGAELPPFLFFDPVARAVTGRDFDQLYDAWRENAQRDARATLERLTTEGLTVTEPVTGVGAGGAAGGPFAVAPRVGPGGARVAYSADDFRSDPATRVVDLATGETRTVARRNQVGSILGPAAWLPDGTGFVTAQLEFEGPYRLHSDLWRVEMDGREERLTTGARLEQPDVAPDGRRVVAVQNHHGAMRLVVYDLVTGATAALAPAAAGEGFAGPRWSPDGRKVAAGRFRGGRLDVVLVDVASGAITPLTADDALDQAPAWTPDGAWVLFWSDRSGIPNLYAAPTGPEAGPLLRVTNVVGGAFDPDVSPDGAWIYFSAYHADGWRIERLPLRPEEWRTAPPPALAYAEGLLPAPPAASAWAAEAAASAATAAGGASRLPEGTVRYSPGPSLHPYFWLPTYTTASAGPDQLRFLGLFSAGWDVLQRHRWQAGAAFDVGSGRFAGDAAWTWRGLGVPELTVSLARDWSGVGQVGLGQGRFEGVWYREDRAALDAFFLQRRWRSTGWLHGGTEIQGRAYDLDRGGPEGDSILADLGITALPTLVGARIGAGWGNARSFPYSISIQDGIWLSVGARRWWEANDLAHGYDQIQGRVAGYLGFPSWGFADHVVAGRVSALRRDGPQAVPTAIGGVNGSAESLLGLSAFGGSDLFLPVRGYDEGDRAGTRAWTASAEYRVPLHLSGWRGDILGFSVTAVSGTLFADAGEAWCADPFPGCRSAPGDPLLSAGAELSLDFGVLHSVPLRVRGGLAVPFTDVDPDDGRAPTDPRNWRPYLVFGPSF